MSDHHHREWIGQIGHHIDPVLVDHTIQQQIGKFADFTLKLADPARREGAAHQPAKTRMYRRIGKNHAWRVTEHADALLEERRTRRHAREMLMVAQYGSAIGIPGHQRHWQENLEQPWRPAHKWLVVRIRIGAERLVPRVEIDLLGLAHAAVSLAPYAGASKIVS